MIDFMPEAVTVPRVNGRGILPCPLMPQAPNDSATRNQHNRQI
jgi:hypothetical protein